MKGLVIKNTGNAYIVRTEDGLDIECMAKGNFRLKGIRSTSPVVVGDIVKVDVNPDNISYILVISSFSIFKTLHNKSILLNIT